MESDPASWLFPEGDHSPFVKPFGLEAVWRRIERLGTIDNLTRIATAKGHPPERGREGALRIRQAIELRRVAHEASALTSPLPLYYSFLNLLRGVMLAVQGDVGAPAHGLSYKGGRTLLDCSAKVTARGTFKAFVKGLGVPPEQAAGTYSLRDLLAVLPEMQDDFILLKRGVSSIVTVKVNSIIHGATTLRYHMPDVTAEDFEKSWPQMLPWFVDLCTLESPHTLRINDEPDNADEVARFCQKHLIHDLRLRSNAFWYDQREGGNVLLLHRLPAYLAAMFILSNVSRYEPQYLDDAVKEPSDLGYFLTTFLENAERFVPQLVLELDIIRKAPTSDHRTACLVQLG